MTTDEEVKQKEKTRELDAHKCVLCGEKASDFPKIQKLPVHHIDGQRGDHSLENLVTLCPSCHAYAHSDEEKESVLDEILRKCDRVSDPRLERGFYC